MTQEERKQLIARAAVLMSVKPPERPAAPPRPPRLDPHLPGEIARLEALVAERERQIAALREQHHAMAGDYDERLGELEGRVAATRGDVEVLEQLAEYLRGESQTEQDAAAVECARLTAAAQERVAAILAEAKQAADEASVAGRELEDLQTEQAALQGKVTADLNALLDQADRLQHGRYADAQRRLPELRARLAARQAEVEAWTASQAAKAAELLAAEQARLDVENEAIRQQLEAEDAAAKTAAAEDGGPTT